MNAGGKGLPVARYPALVAGVCVLLLCGGERARAFAQVAPAGAPTPVSPLKGRLLRVPVHGTSLEGNLEGDTPDRPVSVYLPSGYDASPDRRYPVVYFLHGFTDSDLAWFGWQEHFVNVPAAFERALAAGTVREMILVMPNAYTAFAGSMYSSSVTTGDWERYVAEEVVAYVDTHYRTVPERESRGLVGHSMGGYGAIRIGMKRPDVFSSLFVMSPCCMEPRMQAGGPAMEGLEAITTLEQVEQASFGVKATFASAAAWSPNPAKPPLYLDLPTEGGKARPDVLARWVANAPLATVHQHVPELRRYHAIAMDAGAQDRGIAAATRELGRILTTYGIDHTSEIYDPGNHIDRVDERVEKHVLPFFSGNLAFPAPSGR
jgi:S-formylglutathione hydrolase FrmB